MEEREFIILAGKVLEGTASSAELSLYNSYLNFLQKNADDHIELNTAEVAALWNKIQCSTEKKPRPLHLPLFYKIAAAASVVVIFGLGFLFFNSRDQHQKAQQQLVAEIKPGGNKARLTLGNGRQVVLDQTTGKVINEDHGVRIRLMGDGQLLYQVTDQKAGLSAEYNKIETSVGGQYQVCLPDGTRVWLNSSSSLRYPTIFNGRERKVELTGEAYFEVKEDQSKPFKVLTGTQKVEVLGTKFNINAFPEEEKVRTTLLQGSVNVQFLNKNKAVILKPGEQAVLSEQQLNVITVDTEEFTSWKDGYFLFNNEPIQMAMRKLARWYDVEIVYEGDFKDISFGGTVSRSNSLQKTLHLLEYTNKLKFKIEGRRVKIMR